MERPSRGPEPARRAEDGGARGGAALRGARALAAPSAALAALAGAWATAGTALSAPLAAFGWAAAAVAAARALPRLPSARRWSGAARGFAALHGGATAPMALTEADGALIAANAALRRAAPRAARARRIEEVFDGAAELYRLRRAALSAGAAEGEAARLAGVAVGLAARRVDGDRLLWTARRGPAAAPQALAALGLPAVLLEGGRRRPNGPARAILPDLAAALDAAPAGAPAAPGAAGPEAPLRAALGLAKAEAAEAEEARRAAWPLPPGPGGASPGWLLAPRAQGAGAAAAVADSLERLPVALARLDLHGRLVSVNAPARRLLGAGARPGVSIETLAEGLGRSMAERVAEAARGRGAGRAEIARGRREDRETFLQISLSRVEVDGAAELIAVLGDATELKTLEAQFVQSQKMQAVGQLAGGVAHDFNNLLTAILGHCDLMLMRRDSADADHADLVQIRQNANRAAALVRQMLAFSRKQTLRPELTSLGEVLDEVSHLLNRLIGEKVRLTLDPAPDLGLVRVDRRQFEQVIVNLAVNARDAMPDGGEVRVSARNIVFDRELRRGQAVVPAGDYVAVEVADTGEGIPPDRLEKIFEPFFTTKRPGEGTGLGLSTAYGIVKQTGGFIFADSPPGSGAVFSIYLPRHAGEAPARARPPARAEAEPRAAEAGPAARRRVLLVEDEAAVRAFAARALSLRGFEVVEADGAEAALAHVEAGLEAEVIVSDVVMPGLDGPSWVRRARARLPEAAVVFVSGYAEDVFRRGLRPEERFTFLPKPYELKDLVAAIEEACAGVEAGGGTELEAPTVAGETGGGDEKAAASAAAPGAAASAAPLAAAAEPAAGAPARRPVPPASAASPVGVRGLGLRVGAPAAGERAAPSGCGSQTRGATCPPACGTAEAVGDSAARGAAVPGDLAPLPTARPETR